MQLSLPEKYLSKESMKILGHVIGDIIMRKILPFQDADTQVFTTSGWVQAVSTPLCQISYSEIDGLFVHVLQHVYSHCF